MINVSGVNGDQVSLTWDFGNNGDPFNIFINGQQVSTSVLQQATITLDMTQQNLITISDNNTGATENLIWYPQAVSSAAGINPWVILGAGTIFGAITYIQTRSKKHHG